jgi:transposase
MALHVAVDVHDRSLFAVAVDPATGQELLRRRFPSGAVGEEDLAARLSPGDTVVMEATRGAHHLANRLDRTGASVLIADPQRCRLIGFRGKKTDYRDCLALLSHLRCGEFPAIWRPDPITREARQLSRERRAYNQTTTQLKNRILAVLREEGVTPPGEALWRPEGYQWLAGQGLPQPLVRLLRREWAILTATLGVKETQAAEFSRAALDDRRAWRLLQVSGFGPVSAAMFLGEAGDLSRFPDGKHLASYAGLDPRVSQSGERCKGGGISKGGRSMLRWIMVEVAWSHVTANGPEAGLYHRLVKRGKPKQVAITALARKLVEVAFALLTKEEPYRKLDGQGYLRKLAKLAAERSPIVRKPEGEVAHLDWARARYREIAGQEPPKPPASNRSRSAKAEPGTTEPEGSPEAAAPAPPAEDKAGSASGAGAGGHREPNAAGAAPGGACERKAAAGAGCSQAPPAQAVSGKRKPADAAPGEYSDRKAAAGAGRSPAPPCPVEATA